MTSRAYFPTDTGLAQRVRAIPWALAHAGLTISYGQDLTLDFAEHIVRGVNAAGAHAGIDTEIGPLLDRVARSSAALAKSRLACSSVANLPDITHAHYRATSARTSVRLVLRP